MLIISATPKVAAQESGNFKRPSAPALPNDIAAWLHIGEDGKTTVFTGKAEMGQNIRTSLSQAVAEELHVPVHSVQMVMGDTQLTPFDMGTFGSRTTPVMNLQLRRVAAAALGADGHSGHAMESEPHGLVASDGRITDRR